MPLVVTIEGLNDFLGRMEHVPRNADVLMRAALQNSATLIQRNIRDRAPHKSGDLQRSVLTSIDYPTATVEAQSKYAKFVENGTRPHVIQASKKKALAWKGGLHPYKLVHHPGTKANPFFETGVEASADGVEQQFAKVAEKLITYMAGH